MLLECVRFLMMHICVVCALQVNTAKQAAVGMVAAYPSLLSQTLLEQAALDRGYPPLPDIINQTVPPHEVLTWHHVNMYVRTINVHNMFTYVPFLSTIRTRLLCPS